MIVLGRIMAPYGVRGWVKIQPYGDDPLAWRQLPQWWIRVGSSGNPGWNAANLLDCREHGNGLLARFDGIDDRAQAEELRGALVGAPRETLPTLPDEQFYWDDLVGLAVLNEANELLGRVASLLSTGAHEVLVVQGESGRERLLPFVDVVVRKVDRAEGLIRVDWQVDW